MMLVAQRNKENAEKGITADNTEEELADAFKGFDQNGDGFIDICDLTACLREVLEEDVSDAEIHEMIMEADSDNDGTYIIFTFSDKIKIDKSFKTPGQQY